MKKKNYLVVGSGLSALVATKILISKGIKPTVFDIGNKNTNLIKNVDLNKLPFIKKRNYSFSSFDDLQDSQNIAILKSVGFGGLSKVWGGAISKIHKKNFKKWPITFHELNKYYSVVDSFFNFNGYDDNYSKEFDLIKLNKTKFDYGININKNINNNIFLGYPRNLTDINNKILSSDKIFKKLIKKNKLNYFSGIEVKKFSEKKNKVDILIWDIKKNSYRSFIFDKVYFGSGSIQSAMIILRSFKKINYLILKESKLIPSLWLNFNKIKKQKNLFNCFLYLTSIANPKFHSQIYKINITFLQKILKKFNLLIFIPKIIIKILEDHFLIIFTYLNELSSSRLVIKKKSSDIFLCKTKESSANKEYSLIKKIISYIFEKKIFCLFSRSNFGFGFGYHYGSCLPMSVKRNKYNSDFLGRPLGCKNTHFIDLSVLPEVPINTVTYTAMANAARIVDKSSN